MCVYYNFWKLSFNILAFVKYTEIYLLPSFKHFFLNEIHVCINAIILWAPLVLFLVTCEQAKPVVTG